MDLQYTESFANSAATASATFSSSGAVTASTSPTTGTIRYDAQAKSYTLTISGRSLSFLASDIDLAASSATLTVYKRVDGATTDTLTLTKAGNSGRFTYKYVGGAFWQRTTQGADSVVGSFDAFAYGVKTPDSAVPRSGRAEYSVDLIGTETNGQTVLGVTGQGTMQVDFGSGSILTAGTVTGGLTGGSFSSEAKLSSTGNSFTGTFRYYDFGDYQGTLNGAFYGPQAQEVGAAYSAKAGQDAVAVGVLIGRGTGTTAVNSSLTSLTVNEFFRNDAVHLSTTLTGVSGQNNTGTFSNSSAGPTALIVNYNAELKSYSLIAPERSQYFPPGSNNVGTAIEKLTFPLYADYSPDGELLKNLQYVRAGRWLYVTGSGSSSVYSINDFTYGVRTPDAALPRTGLGGYVISVTGTAADADYPNLMNFGGMGTLTVDFAKGTLSGSGELEFREDYYMAGRPAATANGEFSLSAALSSSANAFTGTLSFAGIGSYTGSLNGGFYGPAAEELGAAFSASDGSGGVATGTILGRVDPTMTAPVQALSNLTSPTQFTAFSVVNPYNRRIDWAYMVYDPQTQTYGYYPSSYPTNAPELAYRFGPSQAVASETNETFSTYAGTGPAGQFNASDTFRASLLNPGAANPRIALTYTSYADVIVDNGSWKERQLAVFGIATPASQVPRSGTGTYSGMVFGHGEKDAGTILFDLDGTAKLSVNFGTQSFTSAFDLSMRTPGSDLLAPLIDLEYQGYVSAGYLSGSVLPPVAGASGSLQGQLFGPSAAEFGVVFGYQGDGIALVGGAVGKRD